MQKNSLILVFILTALVVFSGVGMTEPTGVVTAAAIDSSKKTDNRRLIVYYFHGKKRCMSCKTIEMYTKEAVEKQFAAELKSGRMELKIVNTANPANEHFIKDFQLYTQSVVLVDQKEGKTLRWKNLPNVWKLIRDKDKFHKYIDTEVKVFLAEPK